MAIQLKSLVGKVGKGAVTKQIYIYETWLRWAARAIQFLFALVVIGVYGHRVDLDHRAGKAQASAWVYAVAVGGLSCLTCVVYAIPNPFYVPHRLFAWDAVLFVLWLALFGTFAAIFLHLPPGESTYQGTDVTMEKHVVWLDLVNCLFWLGTAAYGCCRTLLARRVDAKVGGALGKLEARVNDKVSEVSSSAPGGGRGGFQFLNIGGGAPAP
ncbi:hypothetical protein GGR56DRAFT_589202 [Xylariaceae sp. FL0804]|nr:hypothetical protein GGR56DRAFT_589202 [Xylariaceae sp. FL0804]